MALTELVPDLFNLSFTVEHFTGRDTYGNETYTAPVTVEGISYGFNRTWTGTPTEMPQQVRETIGFTGTIIVAPANYSVFDRVTIEGKQPKISSVAEIKNPTGVFALILNFVEV